jgi:DNA-binding response OmpR family regulator
MTMHVLLVEDSNLSRSQSLLQGLEEQGYRVCVVHTPETAVARMRTLWPNLVVFNNANSSLALAIFQEDLAKVKLNVPSVIVATPNHVDIQTDANTTLISTDKLHHLPQSIKKVTSGQQNRFIRLTKLTIDCQEHQVLREEKRSALTPKEFKLLYLLIENQDQVLSRKIIMQQVWETDYLGDTRTLDVHIRWLREKIEANPSQPRRLITIRGVGYRFVAEPEEEGG